MAVKEIMDTLANETVANKKLSELVKDIRLVGNVLEVIFMLPDRTLESEIKGKSYASLKGCGGHRRGEGQVCGHDSPSTAKPSLSEKKTARYKASHRGGQWKGWCG
jgi:hypothetical protein